MRRVLIVASDQIEQVPDFSADWYRNIVGFAYGMPDWLRGLGAFTTEYLMLVFLALFLVAMWRARRDGVALTLAVFAPVAMVTAYVLSESLKSVLRQDRPCRAVPNIQQTIMECPEYGDWSFPSNHSTLAASAAVALLIAWRGATVLALFLALVEGFSRIFVGVHYPHDVVVGFCLGALVAALLMWLVRRFLAPRVDRAIRARALAGTEQPDDAPTEIMSRIS